MKRTLIITAGFGLAALAAPAHAQVSDYESALRGNAMEARVGVIIPFGGDGKSEKSKPQLALMSRRTTENRASVDWAKKPTFDGRDYVETRLALTLSSEPQLRLNGQEIYDFGDEQSDLSEGAKKTGKVALVAGAVMVVIVGAALIKVAACGGDGEDDKC